MPISERDKKVREAFFAKMREGASPELNEALDKFKARLDKGGIDVDKDGLDAKAMAEYVIHQYIDMAKRMDISPEDMLAGWTMATIDLLDLCADDRRGAFEQLIENYLMAVSAGVRLRAIIGRKFRERS